MTSNDTHRHCTSCGASFKKSPADVTRRCPNCRGTNRPQKREHDCIVCCDDRVITEQRADGSTRISPCYRCAR